MASTRICGCGSVCKKKPEPERRQERLLNDADHRARARAHEHEHRKWSSLCRVAWHGIVSVFVSVSVFRAEHIKKGQGMALNCCADTIYDPSQLRVQVRVRVRLAFSVSV